MAHWLLKTEPSTYSFADLQRDKKTRWDGITNPVALKYLRSAAVGDITVIYHTGDVKACMGLAKITKAAYPDPKNEKLAVVDLQVDKAIAKPITLAEMKADQKFADSPLVRQGRLSFVPLTAAQFARIIGD